MTPTEILDLRNFLLLALQAYGEVGVPAATLLRRAREDTFATLTQPQLDAQLRALADESLAISYGTALGVQRWRITGRGTAALQEAGLA